MIKPVRGFVLVNFPTKRGWGEKHFENTRSCKDECLSPCHSLL